MADTRVYRYDVSQAGHIYKGDTGRFVEAHHYDEARSREADLKLEVDWAVKLLDLAWIHLQYESSYNGKYDDLLKEIEKFTGANAPEVG